MKKSTVKKYLYAYVHIVTPVLYLVVSTIWYSFFSTKSLWDNIADNLGILALWYIGISIFWFFNIDYLDSQAEEVSKEIGSKNGTKQ